MHSNSISFKWHLFIAIGFKVNLIVNVSVLLCANSYKKQNNHSTQMQNGCFILNFLYYFKTSLYCIAFSFAIRPKYIVPVALNSPLNLLPSHTSKACSSSIVMHV